MKRDPLPVADNSAALLKIDSALQLINERLAAIEMQLAPPGAADLLRAIHTLIGDRNVAASELSSSRSCRRLGHYARPSGEAECSQPGQAVPR